MTVLGAGYAPIYGSPISMTGQKLMPAISFFYGIVIRMYFGDHEPAHFHAVYGEHEALVSIGTGNVIYGHLPRVAARIVKEWTVARQMELLDNWDRARKLEPLERIPGPEDE